MAKSPSAEVLAEACEARRAGMKAKEILSTFGLSHSQFEFAWLREEMGDLVGSEALTPANVRRLRLKEQKSWGVIAVLCDTTEGKVRKTFSEGTAVKHQGQRIGKGGRWLYSDGSLYEGEFNKPGITIPVGQEFKGREGAHAAQEGQRNLLTEDIKVVIDTFKKVTGRKSASGLTKVEMIRAILANEKASA